MEKEIAKRYRLCTNCSDRILSGSCDGKCKEYWKYVGAKEQKAIDIDNACIILCRYACPHKIDSNKCWNTVCDTWEIFRRMMEE